MRVCDVMVKEFDSILPETTLREAAALLHASRGRVHSAMPGLLVMAKDQLLGMVRPSDLLKAVLPNYLSEDPHLAHLGWDGLLEAQCKRLQNKPVSDVMTQQVITVDEEAVLSEAAELFIEHHVHSLPVTRSGKVVGILFLADLAVQVFERLRSPSS